MKRILQLTCFFGATSLSLASGPGNLYDGELAVLDDVVKAVEHLGHGNKSHIGSFTLSSGSVDIAQVTTLDTSVSQGLPNTSSSTASSDDIVGTTTSSSESSGSQPTATTSNTSFDDTAANTTAVTSIDNTMPTAASTDGSTLIATSTDSSDAAQDTSDSSAIDTSNSTAGATDIMKRSNNRPWRRFTGFRA